MNLRPALPACAVLLALALPAPFVDAQVPDWIADDRAREAGIPLWVAADRAVIDGELQWELFSTDGQRTLSVMIEGARAAAESGEPTAPQRGPCRASMSWSDEAAGSDWTAETIYQRSAIVYVGKILDVQQGFLNARPGTMLELQVEEVLKGPDPTGSSIYIFYSTAQVRLRDVYLCSEGLRGAFAPRLGGSLVYARTREKPDNEQPPVFIARDPELFFEADDAGTSIPQGLDRSLFALPKLTKGLRDESRAGNPLSGLSGRDEHALRERLLLAGSEVAIP